MAPVTGLGAPGFRRVLWACEHGAFWGWMRGLRYSQEVGKEGDVKRALGSCACGCGCECVGGLSGSGRCHGIGG